MHDPPDVASTSGGSGDFCGGNGADDALQDEVLFELLEGNRKYVRWLRDHRQSGDGGGDAEARGDGMCDYLQQIEEDKIGKNRAPLRPVQPKALVISCSRSFSPMDMHRWRNTHHTLIHDVKDPAVSERARRVITMLRQGNDRFCAGRWHYRTPCGLEGSAPPCAVVLGGSESRVPIEDLFDVEPGRLVVQRVLGSVAGLKERTAYSSIQYAVMRWKPPVLLVLVESSSAVVTAAIEELRGHYLPRAPVRAVLEHIMVSAQRAIRQVEEDASLTAAGREIKAQRLTTELNCLYSMEMMLASKNIRDVVRTGEVELLAAIMETGTGKIRFIGPHPRQDDVIRAADLRERTYAAGPASILSREDWENYLPSWALVERRPFTADDAEPATGATGSVGTTALLKPASVPGVPAAGHCGADALDSGSTAGAAVLRRLH
ncbi:hypothetical protein EMIHUDRAFT_239690 [Emiliania huxleyi CCMP1516]|uniref:Carbonic anhydrase n=2 Tax=Emiliania huxleyi TaxID=2903 RepID=A0A0D3JIT5_EMIH1|nr:hypothetical protein EMIHUDRAFT_239690 [Emiliania huxleyi CCMP1516]EOD23420.1 hypothetical protein EMIHUDRAFT_239690 [Emiliania huxleyi CCMP1516]|eukprot:XP_005775849.1 hypothetical protein EMIHUDRAFT_239690 [Emiliania huxleyi CCMP1516]